MGRFACCGDADGVARAAAAVAVVVLLAAAAVAAAAAAVAADTAAAAAAAAAVATEAAAAEGKPRRAAEISACDSVSFRLVLLPSRLPPKPRKYSSPSCRSFAAGLERR